VTWLIRQTPQSQHACEPPTAQYSAVGIIGDLWVCVDCCQHWELADRNVRNPSTMRSVWPYNLTWYPITRRRANRLIRREQKKRGLV
jgi:hypothetical protein